MSNSATLDNLPQEHFSRAFRGIWISKDIWLRTDLSIHEKFLYAEIQSLDDEKKGGCYATNEYLATFMGIKERRLQEIISSLKKKGLIKVVSFNGRQRILKALDCVEMHARSAEKCTPRTQKSAPSTIYNKEDSKEQQQERDSAAAEIYQSLEKIPDSEVSQSEKKRISSKYDEVTVNDAVARVLQTDFVVELNLLKSLRAACKGAWKPQKSKASEKEAQAEKNKLKQYLQEMQIFEKNGSFLTFPGGETSNIKEDDPKEINKIFKKYEKMMEALLNSPGKKKKADP